MTSDASLILIFRADNNIVKINTHDFCRRERLHQVWFITRFVFDLGARRVQSRRADRWTVKTRKLRFIGRPQNDNVNCKCSGVRIGTKNDIAFSNVPAISAMRPIT